MLKKILFFSSALALCIGIGIFILFHNQQNHENKILWKSEKPIERYLIQYVSATGSLRAKDQITIGSLEAGRVVEILVDFNDKVKKDQLLAILDNGIGDTVVKQLKATLEETEIRFKYQKSYYERQKQIYEAKQLSENEFEIITRDFEAAHLAVEQAKNRLAQEERRYNNLFIRSPEDGVIIAKKIDEGQMITSQLDATVLFNIAKDLSDMEAHVDIDEADVTMVKDNQEAVFTIAGMPKKLFSSNVREVQYLAKTVDNVTTYDAVLAVKNPDLILRPGMTVNVDIKVGENTKALSIPNKALRLSALKAEQQAKLRNIPFIKSVPQQTLDKTPPPDTLFIINEESIKEIAVQIGISDGKYTEIVNGITSDMEVITQFIDLETNNAFIKKMFQGAPGQIGRS